MPGGWIIIALWHPAAMTDALEPGKKSLQEHTQPMWNIRIWWYEIGGGGFNHVLFLLYLGKWSNMTIYIFIHTLYTHTHINVSVCICMYSIIVVILRYFHMVFTVQVWLFFCHWGGPMVNICQPAPVPCFQVLKPFTDLHRTGVNLTVIVRCAYLGF